jgi:hypothetical protein
VIQTLACRETRISDTDHLEQEFDHLKKVFKKNGYHDGQIKKEIKKAQFGQCRQEFNIPKITLLYIKGTTD